VHVGTATQQRQQPLWSGCLSSMPAGTLSQQRPALPPLEYPLHHETHHTHAHTHACTQARTHARRLARTHTHTRLHARTHAHTQAQGHRTHARGHCSHACGHCMRAPHATRLQHRVALGGRVGVRNVHQVQQHRRVRDLLQCGPEGWG